MAGKKFSNDDCGELVWVPFAELDINIEIQRDAEGDHQGKIIERFDPRIYMPVMATRLSNGRYRILSKKDSQSLTDISCILASETRHM